ncbi:malate dehydrogenase [Moniliophthora roreri MCA 2997]|uniref:Malate dehydrogenase n=2 Tax=Moniliophthora roreri TaxID=221103 RepID=V2XD36_MONRO|nr:malate dehydrogenase [Moniliophthora roreri MCA 2997]KAI3600369.1 malate dehydrogenase [Moniliophthora roreri]
MKFLSFPLVTSLLALAVTSVSATVRTCDVSSVKVSAGSLPAQKAPTKYIAFGFGTQNYTCGADGKYASAGAVAELLDISCGYKPGAFVPAIRPLGQHYFVTNPTTGTGISPKWDMTSALANPNAFIIGARSAGIPAPTGSSDVDWLYLTNVQGELATEVYRTNTRGGQPPASCTPGSQPITVWYSAMYWFTGGSL